jgi:hypothetical protein
VTSIPNGKSETIRSCVTQTFKTMASLQSVFSLVKTETLSLEELIALEINVFHALKYELKK